MRPTSTNTRGPSQGIERGRRRMIESRQGTSLIRRLLIQETGILRIVERATAPTTDTHPSRGRGEGTVRQRLARATFLEGRRRPTASVARVPAARFVRRFGQPG